MLLMRDYALSGMLQPSGGIVAARVMPSGNLGARHTTHRAMASLKAGARRMASPKEDAGRCASDTCDTGGRHGSGSGKSASASSTPGASRAMCLAHTERCQQVCVEDMDMGNLKGDMHIKPSQELLPGKHGAGVKQGP